MHRSFKSTRSNLRTNNNSTRERRLVCDVVVKSLSVYYRVAGVKGIEENVEEKGRKRVA